MKPFFLFISALFIVQLSSAQITKGNWLAGGSAFFNYKTNNGTYEKYRETNLQLYPNIGYFIADKFAAGLKLGFEKKRNNYLNNNFFGKSTGYSFGPLLRYYFLPAKKQFNILIDGSYQYGIEYRNSTFLDFMVKETKNTFSIAAGPVLYFNPNVGLEFLVGYSSLKYIWSDVGANTLSVGLGLQVHLAKSK